MNEIYIISVLIALILLLFIVSIYIKYIKRPIDLLFDVSKFLKEEFDINTIVSNNKDKLIFTYKAWEEIFIFLIVHIKYQIYIGNVSEENKLLVANNLLIAYLIDYYEKSIPDIANILNNNCQYINWLITNVYQIFYDHGFIEMEPRIRDSIYKLLT